MDVPATVYPALRTEMAPAQSLPKIRKIQIDGDPTDLVRDQEKLMTINFNGHVFSLPYSDLLPPLTTDEEATLFADIAARGVVTPVVVTNCHDVIDGHHRLRLAVALELKEIPIEYKSGLTDEEARPLAIALNVNRRHLDREQQRELIARLLHAAPNRSNGVIAATTRADRMTVESVRRKLESTGKFPS